eukprot:TRINITY_DN26798_c0_g1_i1.p1 TRINITY_DN26798_c0_g1~~TRINITY_DN26798_c0_g1_i1.p1  ORF type:complete len:576 (-),score=112.56 TRINITY_DN26798_c0_g1_i1:212-1810(-)
MLRKLYVRYVVYKRFCRWLANVPTPNVPHHPLLGVLPEFIKQRSRVLDWRYDETVGAGKSLVRVAFSVFSFDQHSLWTSDAAVVRHILKDRFDVYNKVEPFGDHLFSKLNVLLGRGIFTATHGPSSLDGGKLWTAHRKIAAGIFSRRNFNENMGRVFQDKAKFLQAHLASVAASTNGDAGSKSKEVNMQALFHAFTMDSIMDIFFGAPSHTMSGDYDPIASNFDLAHKFMIESIIGNLIPLTFADLAPFPFGGQRGILVSLINRLDKKAQTFHQAVSDINDALRRLILERRKDPELERRSDLLALFMKSTDPNTGRPFSDEALRDIVLNFLIAGRDTTASTLTWLFYELSINPEVQEKLAREVTEALPKGTPLSFEKVMRLPYLNGAIYEALRLHPPVPINFKLAQRDDALPDGTRVPKGTRVWYMPYVMGRDPARYESPLEFRPERWIPFTEPSQFEFPQFQAGPRVCLGKDMAIYEAKLCTAVLLQELSFTLKEGEAENITYAPGLTMALRNSSIEKDTRELLMHVAKRH